MALDGDWKLVIKTPMGPQETQLAIKTKSAMAFDGVMNGQNGRQAFEGTIDGDKLAWQTDITVPVTLTIDFSVTVAGDTMTGSAKLGMFGNAAVTGARA